uniref:Uncharacterized LOC103174897 n=1 Tax=Callorhinchus milii TaxID=7868 RepID=A0A4W3IX76_CALMI
MQQSSGLQRIPQVSLSPEHIIITNGSAGFLRCDATGFYPQEILFRWVKVSHGRETDIIPSDFSTEYKGTNRDGTFSVSSQLRIRPNLDDDGNKYMCVVTHRTLRITTQKWDNNNSNPCI